MTEKAEALRALLEAVEAGDFPRRARWNEVFHKRETLNAIEWVLLDGDLALGAAKSLHEALLPEWIVHDMSQNSRSMGWTVVLASPAGVYVSSHQGRAERQYVASRAWLIAILYALIAEEAGEGGE